MRGGRSIRAGCAFRRRIICAVLRGFIIMAGGIAYWIIHGIGRSYSRSLVCSTCFNLTFDLVTSFMRVMRYRDIEEAEGCSSSEAIVGDDQI